MAGSREQNGPRDLDSVMESRYWLTDAGYAALAAAQASGESS